MSSGRLSFPNAELARLIEIAKPAWEQEVRTLYGKVTGPGFWLVGDEGIYLLHNGKPSDEKRQPLVYARECNPDTTPNWWEAKRAIFGGDDGVDYLDRKTIEAIAEAGYDLMIEIRDTDQMLIGPCETKPVNKEKMQ